MLPSPVLLLLSMLCASVLASGAVSACREKPFFRDAGPLVSTGGGKVVGKYVKVFDADVAAFYGIPYAEPPTGDRRFRKPEKARPWEGLMLAHDKPPPCMQYSAVPYAWLPTSPPSEDCLYLNVWAPARRTPALQKEGGGGKEAALAPVLVWVHGGGLNTGSTDMDAYDGRVVAAYGKAVVVSMNYRLGAFGFLSAGTESAPGNVGFHDQLVAIRWVKENIVQFGGDPDQITLFGESAGAWSISLHLISPLSKGLFNRAILQSGTMYHPALSDTPSAAKHKAAEFAKLSNCHTEDGDMEEMVACFRGKDALELAKLENAITQKSVVLFLPSIGDEFLPKAPIAAYEAGDIQQVDVLLGNVRDEGTLFLPVMASEVETAPSLSESQAESATRTLFQSMPKMAVDAVIQYYFHSRNASNDGEPRDMTAVVAEAFGDSFFNCPTLFLAEKLQQGQQGCRVYWLTHGGVEGGWMGVHHFSDVAYVFGAPIVDSTSYSPEDGKFSGDLIRMWADFARTGDPLRDGQPWPPFSRADPVALELNPRSSALLTHPRFDACDALWRPLFATPPPPSPASTVTHQEHVEVTF